MKRNTFMAIAYSVAGALEETCKDLKITGKKKDKLFKLMEKHFMERLRQYESSTK